MGLRKGCGSSPSARFSLVFEGALDFFQVVPKNCSIVMEQIWTCCRARLKQARLYYASVPPLQGAIAALHVTTYSHFIPSVNKLTSLFDLGSCE